MSRFDELRTVIGSKLRKKDDYSETTDRAGANPAYDQMHTIQNEISARSRSVLNEVIEQPKDYQVID